MPVNHPRTDSSLLAAEGEHRASDVAAADEVDAVAFGDRAPSRFGADVEYRGVAGRHEYLVRVRHRFLDTTFTLVIDGVEHDPKAESKALEERAADDDGPADAAAADDDGPAEAAVAEEGDTIGDGLRFTVSTHFSTLNCTVRRPRPGGKYVDAEVLTLRTAGLGGAGEVDIRHGFGTTVLVPEEGSPSAVRDEKRTAHPTRYAVIAAFTKGARYLLPLLGFGALFSGLLEPLEEWIEARVRPAIDAIARMTAPVREWIANLLRPIQEFTAAVLTPVGEFLAAVLRPVRDALRWLLDLLPNIDLPFDVPEWLVDVMVPLFVVVAVFLATLSSLRSRREKLEAARAGTTGNAASGGAVAADGDTSASTQRKEAEPDRETSHEGEDAKSEESADGGEPALGGPADGSSPESASPQR